MEPLPVTCPDCHERNLPDDRYCAACGAHIVQGQPRPVPPPAAASDFVPLPLTSRALPTQSSPRKKDGFLARILAPLS